MSEKVGFVSVLPSEREAALLPGFTQTSERTRQLIDEEMRKLIDTAHDEVLALFNGNREKLDALAQALVRKEPIDEAEAYAVAGVERPPETEPTPQESVLTTVPAG
jgi:cell division protease FtsH